MKQYFVILAMILICQAGSSQTMNQLFNEFSKVKDTNLIEMQTNNATIGNITLNQIKASTEEIGVNNIELLNFDKCSNKIKERFNKAIKELDDPKFETIVTSNEEGNRRKVLIRIEDETIRELVFLTSGDNCNLIRIQGNIAFSDIDKMLKYPKEYILEDK
ncbi:MAG: DUF4252 domain-containing protein [Parabacteroides sp.]|nr:DUF4252 domain-containing protein [Parabacteroides sp.]